MRGLLGRLLSLGLCAALMTFAGFFSEAPAYSQDQDFDQNEVSTSVLGNYLAGRFARASQDTDEAAGFYERALTRDPTNEVLLDQAFQMETMSADWPKAIPLAEQLAATHKSHRMSQFLLGVTAFKNADYVKAEDHFKAASENPIGELTSAIALGWSRLAAGDADGALAAVDLPKQPDWAQFYLRYHRGLIADIAGRKAVARSAFEKMFRQDSRTLRTSLAYAQHAAHYGDFKLARQIIKEQLTKTHGDPHPLAVDMLDRINKKEKTALLITSPTEGLAEVYYGLGEALTGEGGVSLGTIYLQLALYVKPDHAFALAALANTEEVAHRYQDAIATYDKIPQGTPLQSAIDIRKAFNLNSLEKTDEAKAILERLAAKDPNDVRPLEALGNIYRARKQYAEAVTYFTRAIAVLGKPDNRHWGYYYARGTAYERLKKWPAAEADLKRALAMAPDQPLILNYLGYSWVDQGKHLKDGMRLIEKAVQLKPDDGYIVDSLGWAHFKRGDFKEAVRYLERAVEIKPEDPTLNDHLGDAFWKVGREREARFQWNQALSLAPEPEDAEKIKAKIERGLDTQGIAKNTGKTRQVQTYEPSRRRSENKAQGRTVE
ncbi:MAG TPA: tetratricopeptide repeat protein [Hyphomicrobium sp.]|jgi:tetratricopeptide (TPR) repeat protein|uniref:tetratricopeptide repeat protein n=1 Tax=Hyphomicrobium sp. TaxID=82 RepID=UPI002C1B847E|nr:tetratricopeptide repeat protein [Hyphomicrobium sp.]HXE02775.1 tetratricopeptide repeat protein [Hyphomicrobium sp.]